MNQKQIMESQKVSSRGKNYASVSEMVRELSENPDFAKRAERKLAERNIIDMLMALRACRGLSQKDIAQKIGCTQSRISKLEHSKDGDLRMDDFHAYASALGLEITIFLGKKDQTIVGQVKHHAFAIKRLLARLAKLAGEDLVLASGVRVFLSEAAVNLSRYIGDAARMLQKAVNEIPNLPRETPPLIQVEDEDSEPSSEDSVSAERADLQSAH